MISDLPISEVKSFCLQKTICKDFLGLQSSNQQSTPHRALLSFSGDVSVTLGMNNCYIMSIGFSEMLRNPSGSEVFKPNLGMAHGLVHGLMPL